MNQPLLLGVNVDHIATLRQARGTRYPDPVEAALLAERSGADLITIHLREDRRHIQDRDLAVLTQTSGTRINLECAVTSEMLDIACNAAPSDVCLVPERRAELTTEGGLDVVGQMDKTAAACRQLAEAGIRASLFIDPDEAQIRASQEVGAPVVELHTGRYAELSGAARREELERIQSAATFGHQLGLQINAGHGLHYHNVQPIAALPQMVELNIGHAIVARSVFDGLAAAVSEMKRLMLEARAGLVRQ